MSTNAVRVSDGSATLTLVAGAATVQTASQPVKNKRLSIEAEWSGTPTGTFSLERNFGGVWRIVPGAAAEFTRDGNAQPAGSASFATWNFINVPGGAWRISYTGSGAGTAVLRWAWGN